MITTIIFDIGNVLADFTWEAHYRSFGYSEEILERLANATVKNPLWNEYDRGVMSDEEIVQSFIERDPGIEKEIREALRDKGSMVVRNDYAIPWIQKLQEKGYRCLYLSNFSESAGRDCSAALDFIPYMDGGILSYQEKVVKPDPEIYRRLLTRYSLKEEESVFLDDTPGNVEAARALGLYGICFQTKEQAEEELRGLGVR